MIQRIQSILLALVAIIGIFFSFIPIVKYEGVKYDYVMKAYNTFSSAGDLVYGNIGIGVLGGIIILLALITIFKFKNRSLQIKLSKLNILLIAIQITAIVLYNDGIEKKIIDKHSSYYSADFQIGVIIPVISLILTYLAIHFIKKDDKLVRAADRLR